MPKPPELLNAFLLILISSGLSIVATLYMVDQRLAESGSRVLVVNTTEMAKRLDDPEAYNALAARMNSRLDELAAEGNVVLDGAMVLRYPAAAAVNPGE